MIGNLKHATEISNESGLVTTNDGTYQLVNGNWVLIILGSTVVIFDDDGSSHLSYRPILMQLTMVEQLKAFISLFRTLLQVADDFLGIKDLKVEKMIQDGSAASLNAVKEVLTDRNNEATKIINCSVHIQRKVTICFVFIFGVFV